MLKLPRLKIAIDSLTRRRDKKGALEIGAFRETVKD